MKYQKRKTKKVKLTPLQKTLKKVGKTVVKAKKSYNKFARKAGKSLAVKKKEALQTIKQEMKNLKTEDKKCQK